MKTSEVKVGCEYLFENKIVKVLERIKGKPTRKINLQSGIVPTGPHRKQKTFRLDTGEIVKANKLHQLN